MRDVFRLFLILTASQFVLLGCEGLDQEVDEGQIVDEETGGEVQWPYTGRPLGSYVCEPFIDPDGNESGSPSSSQPAAQGIIASLYYLSPDLPLYSSVNDYVDNGTRIDFDIFFNQLNVPTRPFDRGFETTDGKTILTPEGDTLYEWFALEFEGKLKLGEGQMAGDYQLAILSDDGAVLEIDVDNDGTFETIIDNDGVTPTRMGCATDALFFAEDTEYSYRLRYFQGPRYHIAMVLMMRPLPENPADDVDPECGRSGNSRYFDSTQSPPEPRPAYLGLLDRGWAPLSADNYVLHEEEGENPCNAPAPTISDLTLSNITQTGVDVAWSTDVFSVATIEITEVLTNQTTRYDQGLQPQQNFEVSISDLKTNTVYALRVIATSTSGLSSTSMPDITFRTAR